MPIVNIKGTDQHVEFPDNMMLEEIQRIMSNKYTLPQRPQTVEPVNQSLVDKAGMWIGDKLSSTGIISDPNRAHQTGQTLASVGEFLPGIGDVAAGDEFGKALAEGDKFGMAMSALGVIPVVGDAAKKGLKALNDLPMDEASRVSKNISDTRNPNTDMMQLNASNASGDVVSNLSYSENPIITYTSKGRNPEDYVYIEWMETDKAAQGKGHATELVKHLKSKFPDKTIIADANDNSSGLLKRLGVTLIETL